MSVGFETFPITLDLSKLGEGQPGLHPNGGVHLAQAAAVCFQERGHASGRCQLTAEGRFNSLHPIRWPDLDDRAVRQWSDPQEATEQGAVGVAILLLMELSDLVIVERSRKGTGIDYWLGRRGIAVLQRAARLEVSGIRSGDRTMLDRRVKAKIEQTRRSDGAIPASIIVVEFGAPIARIIER